MDIKWKVPFLAGPVRSSCRFSLCMLQPNVVARHRQRARNQAAASRMCWMTRVGGTWLNWSLQSASPIHSAPHEPNCLIHVPMSFKFNTRKAAGSSATNARTKHVYAGAPPPPRANVWSPNQHDPDLTPNLLSSMLCNATHSQCPLPCCSGGGGQLTCQEQAPTVTEKIFGSLWHAAACFRLLVEGTILFQNTHTHRCQKADQNSPL